MSKFATANSSARISVSAPQPTLSLNADRGLTVDPEGLVSNWKDDLHPLVSALQESATSRPRLVKQAFRGHSAIRFNGAGSFFKLAGDPITGQEFTVIAMVSDRDTTGRHRELLSNWNKASNVGTSIFVGMTGVASARLTDDFSPVGAITKAQDPFLFTAVSSSTSVGVFQNRQEIARRISPLSPRNSSGPYVIGQQGNINGEFWNGDVLELRVYNRALTDPEREQVWDELSKSYGIAAKPQPVNAALVSLCHILFNSNEFIYVD